MAENINLSFDGLLTNIKESTHNALLGVEAVIIPPHMPLPDEDCLETLAGWEKSKSGYDSVARCMVQVTEMKASYHDSYGNIFVSRDVVVAWENGESVEFGLDEGSFTTDDEPESDEHALHLARRILHAVVAVAP